MKKFKKYIKAFELGLQSSMEYRANFALSLISSIFPMIMQIFLWTAIFFNSKEQEILGYDYMQMISYIVIASIINKLVSTGFEWDIAEDIKNGGLNKFITRPVGYFSYRIFSFLGSKVMQLAVVSVILTIILTVINSKFSLGITPERIALFLISIPLALLINTFICIISSSTAFWMTESWAAFIFMNLLVQFSSGGLFPVDILGKGFMKLLDFLPFKYIVYFPTNIINGKLPIQEIFTGIIMQCLWIAIMFILAKISWKIGMKKYIAVGG